MGVGLAADRQEAPALFSLPEEAIAPLNARLRREGRPFEALKRPEKHSKSQRGMRVDAVIARILDREDPRRLALPETASVGSVHLAQTLRDGDFGRARGTSVCEEELVRRMVQVIAAGDAVELLGSDGTNYYRVGENVLGATRKDGGGIDLFPVSGPDMLFLGEGRNREAEKVVEQLFAEEHLLTREQLAVSMKSDIFTPDELMFIQQVIFRGEQ